MNKWNVKIHEVNPSLCIDAYPALRYFSLKEWKLAKKYTAFVRLPSQKRTLFFIDKGIVNSDSEKFAGFFQLPEMEFKFSYADVNGLLVALDTNLVFIIDNDYYLPPLPNMWRQEGVCFGFQSIYSRNINNMFKQVIDCFFGTPFNLFNRGNIGDYYDSPLSVLKAWEENRLLFVEFNDKRFAKIDWDNPNWCWTD